MDCKVICVGMSLKANPKNNRGIIAKFIIVTVCLEQVTGVEWKASSHPPSNVTMMKSSLIRCKKGNTNTRDFSVRKDPLENSLAHGHYTS